MANSICDSKARAEILRARIWWISKAAASLSVSSLALSAFIFSATNAYDTYIDHTRQSEAITFIQREITENPYRKFDYTVSDNSVTYVNSPEEKISDDDCQFGWGNLDQRISDLNFYRDTHSIETQTITSSFSNPEYFTVYGQDVIQGVVFTLSIVEINDFNGIQITADSTAADPIVQYLQRGDEYFEAINELIAHYCI